jgi:dephospho-CoA kinase
MRIAITGGIAEGKSTVLGFLRDAGYRTVSADAIGREVFLRDDTQAALSAVSGLRPPIAPPQLREAIAANPELRREVNRITHPLIRDALLETAADFYEIPLLIEACLQANFDRIWVVTCGEQEQERRLTHRLGDIEAAKAMLSTQLPTAAKLAFADRIIRTNEAEPSVMRYVIGAAKLELA